MEGKTMDTMKSDSTFVKHEPCPECGSKNNLARYSDGHGYCFGCEYWEAGDDMEERINAAYNKLEVVTTEKLTAVYRGTRGITADTMKHFGVYTYLDSHGNEKHQEYIYPSGGIKTRYFPKEFSAKDLKSDELFGMNLFNAGTSKVVTITEGELDAMSVYQMLHNPKFPNPVVSLPSAKPNRKLWENVHDWLSSFDKIILSIDNDEAGNAVAQRIAKMYPNKVYRVPHDKYKDANEFLQAGAVQEFKSAWFNAKKYTPENVINTTDQFLSMYNKADDHIYVETGLAEFDEMCLGLMQGHFTLFKAQTGIGKTEFMRYLEFKILADYPQIKIAIWHMEETKLRSILGLASYYLQENVTRKDLIEEKNMDRQVQDAITALTKDERLYQFYLNDEDDPLDILSHIRYLSQACGVNYVFFEPIQDISAGVAAEESKEQFLADLSVRLSKLAAELGVGIVTIGHTNDDGAVKYCRMIEQRASVVVDLKRDKMAEDAEERNTTKLLVTKNRPVGPTGYAGQLRFNPSTFTLHEKPDEF
jgi:twinkle protein